MIFQGCFWHPNLKSKWPSRHPKIVKIIWKLSSQPAQIGKRHWARTHKTCQAYLTVWWLGDGATSQYIYIYISSLWDCGCNQSQPNLKKTQINMCIYIILFIHVFCSLLYRLGVEASHITDAGVSRTWTQLTSAMMGLGRDEGNHMANAKASWVEQVEHPERDSFVKIDPMEKVAVEFSYKYWTIYDFWRQQAKK